MFVFSLTQYIHEAVLNFCIIDSDTENQHCYPIQFAIHKYIKSIEVAGTNGSVHFTKY